MSQMEYNKGILRPMNIDTENFSEDDYEDCFHNGMVDIDGELYMVDWEVQRGELPDIKNVTVDESTGFIHFETYHYNGGAHWTEVVESAL